MEVGGYEQKAVGTAVGERKKDVQLACQIIKECYQTATSRHKDTALIEAKIVRIQKRIDALIDMRTDGEVTKEEYAQRRTKLDAELRAANDELTASQQGNAPAQDSGLHWNAIMDTLNQAVDLSTPTISRDILEKFIDRVIPQSKTRFIWKINLDSSTAQDFSVSVEGRKTGYTVCLDCDSPPDGDDPYLVHNIIYLSQLFDDFDVKRYSPSPALHRLLSKASRTISFTR